MIRMIMMWADILPFILRLRKPAKKSARRPPEEGCDTIHSLKWDPLTANDVGRMRKYVREGEGRNGGRKEGNTESMGRVYTKTMLSRKHYKL